MSFGSCKLYSQLIFKALFNALCTFKFYFAIILIIMFHNNELITKTIIKYDGNKTF